MGPQAALALLLLAGCCVTGGRSQEQYYGKDLGALSQLQHGVRGRLYAVDSRTLFLKDFHYDGEGPAAYFYVGSSAAPSAAEGVRLRDERGSTGPLRRYRGDSITLSLPEGKTLKDIGWFSVWCDDYSVNFGDVRVPPGAEFPRPAKVAALRGVHGVRSDPVVVVDAQTLLVPNFSYDGEAPDAKFWVGRGDKPSPQGIRIPDENGKEAPLRRYDKKTIVLTLPGELTVFDIGHFGVWCEAFTVDFGHVPLPAARLAHVPPSLKMLGVSPQSRNRALVAASPPAAPNTNTKTKTKAIVDHEATTYRPSHLRPGATPFALFEQSPDHSALHRRADNYAPPIQQRLEDQYERQRANNYQDPQPEEGVYQQQYQQEQQAYLQNYQNPLQNPEALEYQQQFEPQYRLIPIQQDEPILTNQQFEQVQASPAPVPVQHEIPNQASFLKRVTYYQQQVQENEKLRQQSELLRQQSERLKKQLAEAFRRAHESDQQRHALDQEAHRVGRGKQRALLSKDASYEFQESISPVEPRSYDEGQRRPLARAPGRGAADLDPLADAASR